MNARAAPAAPGNPKTMTDDPSSSITADPAPGAAAAVATSPIQVDVTLDAPEWERRLPFVETYVSETVKATLQRVAEIAARPAEKTEVEVSVLLSSDDRLRKLNHRFRDRNQATNVLSFPQGAAVTDDDIGLPSGEFLGDIAVAYGIIADEAEQAGVAIEQHLAHMVVHGCLHLLGYTHETQEDGAVMEGLETQILLELGIADPYGGPDRGNANE